MLGQPALDVCRYVRLALQMSGRSLPVDGNYLVGARESLECDDLWLSEAEMIHRPDHVSCC